MADVCVSHQVDAASEVEASSAVSDSNLYGLSMESKQPNIRGKPAPATKRDLIIAAWDRLGSVAVGELELKEIQRSLHDAFGAHAELSPAAIARLLADEGAELRHPEIIEFDARWREARIESESRKFKGLENFLARKPMRLKKAEALIKKLERLRKSTENSGDQTMSKRAKNIAVNGRQITEALANDLTLNQDQRAEQAEIAEWLKVWIQTPSLFENWLELRRRSSDFQKKFPGRTFGVRRQA
jgi:hypothetical protein